MRFGEFEIDERKLELRRLGVPVPLQPKPLRLLLYLLENRERIVSKEELLGWWGAAVTDNAVSSALKDIRRSLDDDPNAPRWIQTRRKVGYQFVGVVEFDPAAGSTGAGLCGTPRGLSMSFVGRAEPLLALEALITRQTYVSVHASVEGLAGIGKTELVLQLVHKLAHELRFPGGIFWMDAESPDLRPQWGTLIADRCGVERGSSDERCQKLLVRLSLARELLLIVLDNVTAWSAERPGPLPEGPHVRVLVTTRERNLAAAQFAHLDLDVIRPPHDRALVLQLAGRDVDPGLDDLLKHLAGHALGLELAGAFLGTYRGESAHTYLNGLRTNADAIEREVSERTRYERTVTEAFRTVWERMSDAARTAWQIAACFEPVPATRTLALTAGLDDASLRYLEKSHLIQCAADGRWSMHRLIRDFGQCAGTLRERSAARRRFVEGCAIRALQIRPSGPAVYLEDRPHFDAALRLAPEVLSPAAELQLLLSVGPALMVQRGYAGDEVARVYERAMDIAGQTDRHQDLLLALPVFCLHFLVKGDWRSYEAIASQAYELAVKHGEPRYEASANILTGIGCVYTGRLESAASRLESALSFVHEAPPDRLRGLAVASLLSHLGFLRCLSGKPDSGLALTKAAEDHAARSADPAGRAMARGWWLAALHQFRGEIDDVERCAAGALEIGTTHALPIYQHFDAILVCWARVARDPSKSEDCLAQMRQELTALARLGVNMARAYLLGLAADACARLDRRSEGRALIAEALRWAEDTDERFFEPELWRLRGLLSDSTRERVQCFEQALAVATQQQASWWALRAATELVEAASGEPSRARFEDGLRALYARFDEGLALPDLERARALLA